VPWPRGWSAGAGRGGCDDGVDSAFGGVVDVATDSDVGGYLACGDQGIDVVADGGGGVGGRQPGQVGFVEAAAGGEVAAQFRVGQERRAAVGVVDDCGIFGFLATASVAANAWFLSSSVSRDMSTFQSMGTVGGDDRRRRDAGLKAEYRLQARECVTTFSAILPRSCA